VEESKTGRCLGSHLALALSRRRLVLASEQSLRSRAGEPPLTRNDGGEQGGLVLRPDHTVGRNALQVPEEREWVEILELVEIGSLEVDAIAIGEVRRAYGGQIPLLRVEDKDVPHESPPPRVARRANRGRRSISVRPVLEARTDVVGSLLRPPELLEARRRFENGELGPGELERIEDRAVDDAL